MLENGIKYMCIITQWTMMLQNDSFCKGKGTRNFVFIKLLPNENINIGPDK